MSIRGKTAVVGLGVTPMGKIYGRTATDFASEAIRLAVEDAGLQKGDIDGLLINANASLEMNLPLQNALGLEDLRLLNVMNAYGSTAGAMIQYAALAIQEGLATVVALVYADDPLKPNRSAREAYGGGRHPAPTGMASLARAYGYDGWNAGYALACRRHMAVFGTTHDQLGTIAVGQRQWARLNPAAQMTKPLTLEEYHQSRWIAEPFHLFDCCLVSNGGVAVIVTSAERARSLKQPPFYVLGMGQGAERQVPRHDLVLVSGNGGLLNHHATTILSLHASA